MLTAEQLAGAVDAFTGAASFSFDLLSRPEGGEPGVRLPVSYDGNVWRAATAWNREAPGGVLGLGWSLGLEAVAVDLRGAAAPSGRSYVLISGGARTPLVRTGTADGLWVFATEDYAFWKITYDPARELWRIVREDGVAHELGDAASGRGTVQWGVTWGNWVGESAVAAGQTPVALAWSLSRVVDLWGNATVYTYETVPRTVGPAPQAGEIRAAFTAASYLVRIDGPGPGPGSTAAVLHYAEKTAEEVQPAHTRPAPPNAWQDRAETRYLSGVDVLSPSGAVLFTETLSYALLGGGGLTKRLLTGLRRTWAGGGSLPDYRFSYWGQAAGDGVTATQVYGAANGALYGALKAVTLPEGGQFSFRYGRLDLGLSRRDAAVTVPQRDGYTFSRPRIAFADDYTVVTWYGEAAAGGGSGPVLLACAYAWEGRWLAAELDLVPVAGADAYDAVPLLLEDAFFGLVSGARLYLYHRDPFQAGRWVAPAAGSPAVPYLSLSTLAEPVQLVSGDRFAAVLGTRSGKLRRCRFTGKAWVDDGDTVLPAGSPALFAAAARRNYLAVAGTGTAGGDLELALFHLDDVDALGAWQAGTFALPRRTALPGGLDVQAGAGFVVVSETGAAGAARAVLHRALAWDPDFSRVEETVLGGAVVSTGQNPAASPLTVAVVRGSAVAAGDRLYRFDGAAWQASGLAAGLPAGATVVSLAYGADQVLRVASTGAAGAAAFRYDLLEYDPNAGTWAVPDGLALSGPAGGSGGATLASRAALVREDGAAEPPFAVVGGQLWYRQADGTWVSRLTLPALAAADLDSVRLLESRCLVYQNGADTRVHPLRNGTVAAADPLVFAGETILAAGRRAFATYTGTGSGPWGGAGSRLSLYRLAQEQVSGAQAAYPVAVLSAFDGYQSVDAAYGYDAARATADPAEAPDRARPRFHRVTIVPGSADPASTPHGSTDEYYFNGLAAGETPALAYPSDPADPSLTNAAAYVPRLQGRLYARRVKDDAGAAVASLDRFWQVTEKPLAATAAGTCARVTREDPGLDGVLGRRLYTYSADTGLLTRSSTRSYNLDGEEEQRVEELRYFWEEYDPARELNLLAPVIQTTRRLVKPGSTGAGADVVTAVTATTWKADWGHGAGTWAPWETYRAVVAGSTGSTGSAFAHWQGGGETDPAWLRAESVAARTAAGLPRLVTAAGGARRSTLYDAAGRRPVAVFGNADPAAGEGSFYSCEPYEDPGGWAWNGPGGLRFTSVVAHTGTRSLELPPAPGGRTGPVHVFRPADQGRSYVFSCWARSESGYDPAAGAARWEIAAFRASDGQAAGQPLTLDIPATGGGWVKRSATVDLAAIRAAAGLAADAVLYLVAAAFNHHPTAACQVDALRFGPADGFFAATVYDPDWFQATATVDAAGEVRRTLYDAFRRPVAAVGPAEAVRRLAVPSFSRARSGTGAFVPDFPNTTLELRTTGDSVFERFQAAAGAGGGADGGWTFAGGTWSAAGGRLSYQPSAQAPTDPLGGTATFSRFAFTYFAVRVTCDLPAAGRAALGDGDVFVSWDGQGHWLLSRRQAGGALAEVARSSGIPFGRDWVLAVVEGLVMFWVDGVQILAWTGERDNALPDVGKPVLALGQAGSFSGLAVLDDPQLAVTFADGLGTPRQSLRFAGRIAGGGEPVYQVLASGVLLDELRRPAYVREPDAVPLRLAALAARETLAETLPVAPLVAGPPPGGPPPGEAPIDPVPVPEPEPLLELAGEIGGPVGEGFSAVAVLDGGGAASLAGLEDGAGGPAGDDDPGEEEETEEITLVEGSPNLYLVDPSGAPLTVEQYLAGAGGVFRYTTRRYEKSPLSRLTAQVAPRAAATPPEAVTVTRETVAITSSGEGAVMNGLLPAGDGDEYRLERVTTPDSGKHYTLADADGRVLARRSVLEDGSHQTIGFEYDGDDRVIEVRHPNYYDPPDGSTQDHWKETRTYDRAGRLLSVNTPDAGTSRFLYGDDDLLRFEQTAAGAQSPPRLRYFKYDDGGQLTESGELHDTGYAWGSTALADKVEESGFPDVEDAGSEEHAAGSWHRKLAYDGEGRLAEVRTHHAHPGIETETFLYDAAGRVVRQTLEIDGFDAAPFSFLYRYDNEGGLAEITYPAPEGGEAFQVGYYRDRLGRLESIGDAPAGSGVVDPGQPFDPAEERYAAYGYDAQDRVVAASLANSLGGSPAANPVGFARTYRYTPQGWLEGIDDPYLSETFGYDFTAAGSSWRDGRIAHAAFACKPEKWADPPADHAYAYSYDRLGRLTAALHGGNDAWSLRAPASGAPYDANGNRLSLRRGATTTDWHYAADGAAPSSNRLHHRSHTAAASLSFTGLTGSPSPPSPWTWGSGNGGGSTSAVETDAGRGAVLKLGGGRLGHAESLRLQTWLDPAASYTLRYAVKTEDGFASGIGQAGWVLRLYSADGEVVTRRVSAITDTAGTWEERTVTLDLPGLLTGLGLGAEVSYAVLECVNGLRAAAGSGPGPALYLDAPAVLATAEVTESAYVYDGDGNVTSSPARGLQAITYGPASGLPTGVTLSDASEIVLAYGAGGGRSLELHRAADGTLLSSLRTLRRWDGEPLVEIARSGSAVRRRNLILGRHGILAREEDGAVRFLLQDRQGSTRAVVDGDTGAVVESYDYLPWGEVIRRGGDGGSRHLYGGWERDATAGLYADGARLYDPRPGLYYAADPEPSEGSPYVLAGNDPLALLRRSFQAEKPAASRDTAPPVQWVDGMPVFQETPIVCNPKQYPTAGCPTKLYPVVDTAKAEDERWQRFGFRPYSGLQTPGTSALADSAMLEDDLYIFVLDPYHRIIYRSHADRHRFWLWPYVRHSQIASGKAVYCSGTILVQQGLVTEVQDASGHYFHGLTNTCKCLDYVVDTLNFLKIRTKGNPKKCHIDLTAMPQFGQRWQP